jgi:hypothetical protein
MGLPPRPPSWKEIEEFCRLDGWEPDRRTKHVFWRKTLDTGQVLETHRSLSERKSMGPGRFHVILNQQLKVSRAEFWRVLQTGEPARRPSVETEASPVPTHELWVVRGLKGAGVSEAEIGALSPEEAIRKLQEFWARRR